MTQEVQPSLAERLKRELGRMTPNEKRAAVRLLADFPMAGLDTAARFGEAAGVSAPTVLRMIAKLGISSYGAFQDELKAELAAQRETPLAKGAGLGGRMPRGDPLSDFAAATIDNLRATSSNVPRDEFAAVAAMLADGRRAVHLLGGRFTDAIAEYATVHLRVLRPGVRHIAGQPAAWLDQLLDIEKRDVVLLFDIRRYSDDLLAFAERVAARGAIVVLVTDQWLSPISRVARHVLPAHVAVPSVWDSSAGLLLVVEALLAEVAKAENGAGTKRLQALEAIRGVEE
ncbi:DNA-binding MurR/RpiR family transcriptional regulator [Kaistia hirudinis]|uniref:DNA-binding MurR/RpiR family transcriptional regulator n=1 Tax=Kaistia hirudinis TaxID=1293440 RepID=A0A840AU18_9HYPH|nr:MurR/RpiR family transcriptional regulator [Kaistia hirudinis]MBB3933182.1 DNA-binding MurR/RpiR family transcriptional regulator [Kaistia hirudinis]